MKPSYICVRCLAIVELAGGVTFKRLPSNPLAECDCGKRAEIVIDLDQHSTPRLRRPVSCAECKEALAGCESPELCRVIQASRLVA